MAARVPAFRGKRYYRILGYSIRWARNSVKAPRERTRLNLISGNITTHGSLIHFGAAVADHSNVTRDVNGAALE